MQPRRPPRGRPRRGQARAPPPPGDEGSRLLPPCEGSAAPIVDGWVADGLLPGKPELHSAAAVGTDGGAVYLRLSRRATGPTNGEGDVVRAPPRSSCKRPPTVGCADLGRARDRRDRDFPAPI